LGEKCPDLTIPAVFQPFIKDLISGNFQRRNLQIFKGEKEDVTKEEIEDLLRKLFSERNQPDGLD
jgi:hypothetical protein